MRERKYQKEIAAAMLMSAAAYLFKSLLKARAKEKLFVKIVRLFVRFYGR